MRVVHITDTYLPANHPIAAQVAGLARRQGARGDAVHVLTASPLRAAEPGKSRFRTSTTDAPGVRVHRLASRLALGRAVLPRGRATIERALGLLRPDVVHLHLPGPSPFGYDAARAARAMDLPLLITAYAGSPETFSSFAVRVAGWSSAPVVTSGVNSHVAAQVAEIFGEDTPLTLQLGADLEPWWMAGQGRTEREVVRVLVHAGRRTKRIAEGIASARAQEGERLSVTAIGPEAGVLAGADIELGDAPAEVWPVLAAEHDVYVSAEMLDPHAAGAAAAGMVLVGYRGTAVEDLTGGGGIVGETGARVGGFLIDSATDTGEAILKLADSPTLRTRMRAGILSASSPAAHDWAAVLATADDLYDAARERMSRHLAPH